MIYLDMDGPMTDFHLACEKAYNKVIDRTYSIEKALGVTKPQFVDYIDSLGLSFWAEMPMADTCMELLKFVENYFGDDYMILTNPGKFRYSCEGKRHWCKSIGIPVDRIILCGKKHLLVRDQNDLLIDDDMWNCFDFLRAGGSVAIVPFAWNIYGDMSVQDKLECIKKQLFKPIHESR